MRREPEPERRVAAEPVEAVERAQERLLGHVLGVIGAGDPARQSPHRRLVTLDQLRERLEIPAPRTTHEEVICRGEEVGTAKNQTHLPRNETFDLAGW